ncbi:hypothetical protein GH714_015630 [Hevea brasiliensis]|uniref:Uncharacterized protein n=1 Tax=Hevea brasiliensis TaxID=3981 RepID=A0A6A6L040_HEVBR|nr:hypothetical protein GH714_015630 [Hevea brasiliensis]
MKEYFENINELHFYAKHPISQPELSYDFPNLPSIVSNIDTDPSFENETLGARKSVRARTWGMEFSDGIDFRTIIAKYAVARGVKIRGRFQQYKKYCHKLNIDTMLDISRLIGVRYGEVKN